MPLGNLAARWAEINIHAREATMKIYKVRLRPHADDDAMACLRCTMEAKHHSHPYAITIRGSIHSDAPEAEAIISATIHTGCRRNRATIQAHCSHCPYRRAICEPLRTCVYSFTRHHH